MAAHRYWRIKSRGGPSDYFSVKEVEFRTSAGGSDVTGSGTATIGAFQDGAAANCFDNNTSNYCQQSPSNSAWIAYDFGSGNDKDIVEVQIIGSPHGTDRSPQQFNIEYSDDNSTWTVAWLCEMPAANWTLSGTKVFTKPSVAMGAARYWRVRFTETGPLSSTTCSVSECEMMTTVGGSDVTGSGTAMSRSNGGGSFTPDKAFDNSTSTYYTNGTAILGSEFLGYDFGSGNDKDVKQIRLLPRQDSSWTQFARGGSVECSPDGANWLQRWSYTGALVGQTAYLDLIEPASLSPGSTHRYWSLRVSALGSGGPELGVSEVEFRATPGGADTTGSGAGALTAVVNAATPLPSVAFDNNTSTDFAGGTGSGPWWLGYDYGLGSGYAAIPQVTIRSRGNTNQAPTAFDVRYSDDNQTWTVAWSATSPDTWGSGETRTFTDPAPASPWVPRILGPF